MFDILRDAQSVGEEEELFDAAISGNIEQLMFDWGCRTKFMKRLKSDTALISICSFSHAEKSGDIEQLTLDRGFPEDFMLQLMGETALITIRSFYQIR